MFARPSWHSLIFYVGAANVARTLLARGQGDPEPHAHVGVYALCAALAVLVARLVERARSALTSRVCSASLGMTGLLYATLHGDVHPWAPVPAAALLVTAVVLGEAAFRIRGTRRPSWHSVIFFVASAGLSRTVLVVYGAGLPLLVHCGTYLVCLVFALAAAGVMVRMESPLTPRVHSGSLGLTGLLVAAAHADTPAHAPVAVTALVLGVTCVGELAYRRRSALRRAQAGTGWPW
ncbi:hypothetical protein [Phytohabitans houttuyneae]|uniref:Uncharacterized protein n=1 Tax=Phytohabitans houttuyneae TaxID=1076126 RepID=A0A6V8K057_9ACTN|nr:hypothetical protein [Phytohabitans houttuyneae]GFJ78503.1 hypothetical protein Phou_026830 [Phytohabitans houttuyneae]